MKIFFVCITAILPMSLCAMERDGTLVYVPVDNAAVARLKQVSFWRSGIKSDSDKELGMEEMHYVATGDYQESSQISQKKFEKDVIKYIATVRCVETGKTKCCIGETIPRVGIFLDKAKQSSLAACICAHVRWPWRAQLLTKAPVNDDLLTIPVAEIAKNRKANASQRIQVVEQLWQGAHCKRAQDLSVDKTKRKWWGRSDAAYLAGIDWHDADLRRINLYGAYLPEANFSGAFLEYAMFATAFLPKAVLANVNCSHCNFHDAVLHGSNMKYGNFEFADFMYADLNGADVKGANFMYADFHGADLRNVRHLEEAVFAQAICDSKTKLPEGFYWDAQAYVIAHRFLLG